MENQEEEFDLIEIFGLKKIPHEDLQSRYQKDGTMYCTYTTSQVYQSGHTVKSDYLRYLDEYGTIYTFRKRKKESNDEKSVYSCCMAIVSSKSPRPGALCGELGHCFSGVFTPPKNDQHRCSTALKTIEKKEKKEAKARGNAEEKAKQKIDAFVDLW